MERDRLLEDLSKICNCYISTLKSYPFNQLMQYCSKIESKDYDLEEWNYFLSYILETKVEFICYEDIEEYLRLHEE